MGFLQGAAVGLAPGAVGRGRTLTDPHPTPGVPTVSNAHPALIHSLDRAGVDALCQSLGQPAFRARQLWHWLYERRLTDWNQASNLPRAMLDALRETFRLDAATRASVQGEPDGARKLLVRLTDGDAVETVLIPAADRRTVCVSTQVGCRHHCAFCASGQAGWRRNLEAGEIVGQVLLAWQEYGERPTHVVFMGIGEPMDNYDATLTAVRILNDHDGINIGARRITLSTCGVVPGIERLGGEGLQIELSVSLHAPDDALRSRLMPVNRKYPLDVLMPACRAYAERTGRIVTFEYTLIRGVNDTPEHARQLVARMAGIQGRVNLIPLSPVPEFSGETSTPEAAQAFMAVLERAGINVTLRSSRGAGVRGACGQLRFSPAGGPAETTP